MGESPGVDSGSRSSLGGVMGGVVCVAKVSSAISVGAFVRVRDASEVFCVCRRPASVHMLAAATVAMTLHAIIVRFFDRARFFERDFSKEGRAGVVWPGDLTPVWGRAHSAYMEGAGMGKRIIISSKNFLILLLDVNMYDKY